VFCGRGDVTQIVQDNKQFVWAVFGAAMIMNERETSAHSIPLPRAQKPFPLLVISDNESELVSRSRRTYPTHPTGPHTIHHLRQNLAWSLPNTLLLSHSYKTPRIVFFFLLSPPRERSPLLLLLIIIILSELPSPACRRFFSIISSVLVVISHHPHHSPFDLRFPPVFPLLSTSCLLTAHAIPQSPIVSPSFLKTFFHHYN
jgi:hypothetical protein